MTAATARVMRDDDLPLTVAGVGLLPFCDGTLYWPDERMLIVADLHFEKGSAYATRGTFLPPYDTAATLLKLARRIALTDPRTVVTLGDNFHDRAGGERLSDRDRETIRTLQKGRDWIWINGNHDPEPQDGLGGTWCEMLSIGPLVLRHEPTPGRAPGELAGHLHPAARVRGRQGSVRRPCFAGDGERLVLPSFGALTGGLDVHDRAFSPLFDRDALTVWLLGRDRVYGVSGRRLGTG